MAGERTRTGNMSVDELRAQTQHVVSEANESPSRELSFLVLSQPAKFNAARAQRLRRSIIDQIKGLDQEIASNEPDSVFLTHELFPEQEGAWAITPILHHIRSSILKAAHRTARWLIVCEEQSHVNVSLLTHHLAKEDYREKLFLGYPLYDREATIIHHFAFFKNPTSFLYPYLTAGVALTVPLVDHLVDLLTDGTVQALSDFFIDPAHEFALLVWQHGAGYPLQPRRYLCAKAQPGCAIWAATPTTASAGNDRNSEGGALSAGDFGCANTPTDVDRIMFAVKTCHKYHHDRIPVLQRTWTRHVQHLRYFSDVADPSIPTVVTSVPNSSAGHCAKTLEILQLIGDEIRYNVTLQAVRWVMLVDDDTILSSSSLARFLSCYDPGRDWYLGERYGYHLMGSDGGYNYVTGGGGIVLSVAILDALQQTCECPSPSSPDDMILAACLQRLGVRPIHSPLFHQARPTDYPPELLDPRRTVSFHKHWQIDPHQVYNRWFRALDEQNSRGGCEDTNSRLQEVEVEENQADASSVPVEHRKHGQFLRPASHIAARNENDSLREHRPTTVTGGPLRMESGRAAHQTSPETHSGPLNQQPGEHMVRRAITETHTVPFPTVDSPVLGTIPTSSVSTGTPTVAGPVTPGVAAVAVATPTQHIARKQLCESNELQSNGDFLLRQQANLQESTNIIKHTDL
ncbi:beta-1,3-glucosyltransferase [Anopheles ziemanni]|uniref:beta-1,3-glucosyltransferase n=1 Tax=Anopheles ziemanni TaxID=345580 RepID=UPI00265FBF4C|nr:beta-1,3-glucosyltransferase [Anopheles ziemanni]